MHLVIPFYCCQVFHISCVLYVSSSFIILNHSNYVVRSVNVYNITLDDNRHINSHDKANIKYKKTRDFRMLKKMKNENGQKRSKFISVESESRVVEIQRPWSFDNNPTFARLTLNPISLLSACS